MTRAPLPLEDSHDFVSILGILHLGNFEAADHAARGFFRERNYRSTKFTLATNAGIPKILVWRPQAGRNVFHESPRGCNSFESHWEAT